MEFLESSYTNAFVFISSFFLLVLTLLWFSSNGTKKNNAPPHAGGAWPIIGHLRLLGGPQPPHIVLGNLAAEIIFFAPPNFEIRLRHCLADKYGPIFTIKMGVHRTLVVNSWEMAKECLTTNDKAFANRPQFLAADILGCNSDYGPYWRHIRKVTTVELLSLRRLEMLRSSREAEVRAAVRELHKLWEKDGVGHDHAGRVFVEMRKWIGDITLNVILRLVVGKSVGYGSEESWMGALKRFFEWTGKFVVSDAVPFLRFLDIGGSEKEMKKVAKELDDVVEVWIKEHKEKRLGGGGGEEDFMGLMLSLLDEEELPGGHDPNTINKSTCLALILAGSDTTGLTLTWALSLLVNHPKVLKKVQDELDLHVGRERQVQESDVHNLVYLQAVVKETLRLYPAAPLSVPHESIEDCTVAGYHIPAKTRLFVNLRKIQRDPRSWSDPDQFQPERFLTKDTDYRGKNFDFIPFGSGRRICPGISFAQHVVQLTLAMLLQGFDFGTKSGGPVDMIESIESIGSTNPRATPLELSLSPRLPSHLYA